MIDQERVRELRRKLFDMVQEPLSDAWVNDDYDDCASLDELEELARMHLSRTAAAAQAFRSFLAMVKRERNQT